MHISSPHPLRYLLLFYSITLFLLPTIFASTLSSKKPSTSNTTTLNDQPTIVLLTDAFHLPTAYSSLLQHLSHLGFPTATWRLPSVDSPTPRKQSVALDAIFIRHAILLPRINSGAEVVVLMHSYGGAPGSMAARGLSVEERRREGRRGGVLGMIFVCGVLVREGVTVRDVLGGGRFEEWIVRYKPAHRQPPNLPALAPEFFYNDLPPSSPLLAPALSHLRNQSLASLESPTSAPAWADPAFDNRRSYLRTEIDRVIPLRVQQAMLRDSGVRWRVAGLGVLGGQVGHAPFLSRAGELAGWVAGEVGLFGGGGGGWKVSMICTPGGN
ncbi:hypothetical protein G7Y79_00017g042650 [Physcia stellaris]|nr:hypothetical protein G7Y79_00017g042650 [Physcia stellaris]